MKLTTGSEELFDEKVNIIRPESDLDYFYTHDSAKLKKRKNKEIHYFIRDVESSELKIGESFYFSNKKYKGYRCE